MILQREDIVDDAFESRIFSILSDAGFAPERSGDQVVLRGVGVLKEDSSVNLSLNLIALEGHRILEIVAPIQTKAVSFEHAVLIAAEGNLSCLTAKFTTVEDLPASGHHIQASLVLFADHISDEELSRMLFLFIKEVDHIDGDLIQMSKNI